MRFPARKFAVFLWVGAAIVLASIWLDMSLLFSSPPGLTANESLQILLKGAVVPTIIDMSILIGAGAIIWLLGDIRDRLDPPQ